jgi:hypothetical protein
MAHNTRHKPPHNSKPTGRPRRRKRVTLIAAFRTSEGVVICADSQETLGNPTVDGYANYRCRVNKLEPQLDGEYHWVAGGSGDGDLVDGFIERLRDDIASWPGGLDLPNIKSGLLASLLTYRANEVAVSGIAHEQLDFLICIKPVGGDPLLFKAGKSVRLIKDYALIGWDEGIYRHDVQRFYRENAGGLPSILLGIHVLLLAMATNNNIGPPIKVIVVTRNGISEIEQRRVSELSKRVEIFNQMIDQITLDLSDTCVPIQEFRDRVTRFRDNAVILHDHYINSHVWGSFLQVLGDKTWKPDPVQEMPPGSVVTRTKEGQETVVEFKHEMTFLEDLLDDDLDQD